ncbi:MAG: Na(+)/H(+) antiporter subunit D [Betaproteobacteria bacterium RIFCSPLOWO2_02_FULL_63_19]|nr:MAG: Na(+)/H(+) antiporter subunit D [Betaproteobacteria bacterium RIFCSPLOWO2_02_FULL_63_19]
MSIEFPTALILILGALAVPFLRGRVRALWMLALPVLAFAHLVVMPTGEYVQPGFLGQTLVLMRVDRLSLAFGYIFTIATLLNVIYSLHEDDPYQQVAALAYAGSALGAVFAGDLITLFIYWELTAVTSVVLIWARRTERARRAAMRYLLVQLASGMLLLAGAVVHFQASGSIRFDLLGVGAPGSWLILLAFGIKCAFPLLHNWLQDAYPEATVTGTVWLSAFTTKLAVYALARGYAGTEMLIWIGAVMTAFPIFYAVIENDLRRVLAYSLNNQLGFMVVGVGIGTELAINGTVAHAFSHILYKALLFMSMGAVLLRAGTVNGSQLGGLYKSMPWTTGFCIVGAASISAFPLFSGFISKALILGAAADGGYTITWLVLLFASAGVFHHSGIKIPYFAFFAHDSKIRCAEAPRNMLIAMGLTAVLCVGIGVYPDALYRLLPHAVTFVPYTSAHVLTQLQLLLFSALAFSVLMRTGLYPPELRAVNLDCDWFYRKLAPALVGVATTLIGAFRQIASEVMGRLGAPLARVIRETHGDGGPLSKTLSTGTMALWISMLLAAYLVMYYV